MISKNNMSVAVVGVLTIGVLLGLTSRRMAGNPMHHVSGSGARSCEQGREVSERIMHGEPEQPKQWLLRGEDGSVLLDLGMGIDFESHSESDWVPVEDDKLDWFVRAVREQTEQMSGQVERGSATALQTLPG